MKFYVYKDQRGEWRWRLAAANGRIIADSAEGYKRERDCLDDIDRVKASSSATVIKDSNGGTSSGGPRMS